MLFCVCALKTNNNKRKSFTVHGSVSGKQTNVLATQRYLGQSELVLKEGGGKADGV